MIQEKRLHMKCVPCAPGGMNCTCCFPARGPFRKKIMRSIKRSSKNEVKKILNDEIRSVE